MMRGKANKPMITLEAWAKLRYDPAPAIRTLRRWANAGNIQPAPQKIGRIYMVNPAAKYVDTSHFGTVAFRSATAVSSSALSERALRILHGQAANNG